MRVARKVSSSTDKENKKWNKMMKGKLYRHPRFGKVKVLIQPNYRSGGPRNVAIRILETEKDTIVPQRSLKKIKLPWRNLLHMDLLLL